MQIPVDAEHAIGQVTPAGVPAFGDDASVTLDSGAKIHAKLIVAADGAQSRVRQAANIGTCGWDYDQRAVVATVRTSTAHSTAWQRFLPTGPVAILPVSFY